jgi:hypothetical protein
MSPALDTSTAAAPNVIATTVAAVTVFRNGALVVRKGTGRGLVEVRDLPLLFSADTLRVKPARGAVVNLEETVRLVSKPADTPVSDEERARIALDIAAVDDEIQACDLLLATLGGLVPELPHKQAEPGGLVDGKLFVDLVSFSGARATEVGARRAELVKKRRALEDERRRIDERARAVPAEAPRVLRGARFTLDVEEPTPFDIEYFVSAARWVPTYALHLSTNVPTGAAQGRLVTAALVAQASGEDWTGAELAVSTADLARDTTLPVLSSWRIGRAQAAPSRAWRPLPSDLPTLFHSYDKAPRKLPPAPVVAKPAPPPAGAKTGGIPLDEPQPLGRVEQLEEMDDDDTGKHPAADVGSDEARAFEQERSSSPRESLRRREAMAEMADEVTAAVPMPPMQAQMRPMPMAPGALPAASMAPPPMAKRAAFGGLAGGGGPRGGRADDEGGAMLVAPELPPRWRTASMRMAGPDEPRRGSLLPLDTTSRLEWLLRGVHEETDDAQDADRAVQLLQQALRALTDAQRRLEQAPLPRGTSPLAGTHFQSVMKASSSTDVPGDGTFYRVEVRADEAPALVEHRAVPRESNDVWRTCRLELKGPPLPSGPLVVYENGAFRVNARLDGSGAGKPLDVNLGVDPDVRILARTVHTQQAEKGLMSQTSRVQHHVKVELRSTARAPAQVTLHDRLPLPADGVKDVTVEVLEEKPPLKRTNKDALGNEVPGAFEWKVTVMPGDTMNLELKYAIDLPAKAELEGGNRRE